MHLRRAGLPGPPAAVRAPRFGAAAQGINPGPAARAPARERRARRVAARRAAIKAVNCHVTLPRLESGV